MNRTHVPQNKLECFAGVVLSISDAYGVRDVPEIYRHVEMLCDAVQTYLAEKQNGTSTEKSENAEKRRKFISLFNEGFKKTYGVEYPSKITPADCSIAVMMCEKIDAAKVTYEDYINWVFNVFLPENSKIRLAQFKTLCSDFFFNNFIVYVHESGLDKTREREQKRAAEINDIANRIRAIKREHENDTETLEKLKKAVELFKAGKISVRSMSAGLSRLEAQLQRPN